MFRFKSSSLHQRLINIQIKPGYQTALINVQKYKKVYLSGSPLVYNQVSDNNDNDSQKKKKSEEDSFLSSMINNKTWLTTKIDWPELPSMEAVNEKLNQLYPEWSTQFKQLHENYQKLWDFLTVEDFKEVLEELKHEQTDTHIHPELLKDASVRESNQLSNEEREFIIKRKHMQRLKFANFIGVDVEQVDERDIPIVGLATSGGGYRAMIGTAGYLQAIKSSGVLDCVMYFAGISGSCWTMALYYNPITNTSPELLKHHLISHVGTHWANMSNFTRLLTASAESTKLLLRGIVQRYHQQKGDISLVDLFGTLMGTTLLTKQPMTEPEELNNEKVMHLTDQSDYLKDGSQPLPIYCVVRHDILVGKSLEDRLKELKNKYKRDDPKLKSEIEVLKFEKKESEAKLKDTYQWFEFTPYEMGSEEIEAWVPTWSFGRKFEKGFNTERLPEQPLDILIGMFGSAFAASLVHFYKEIRSFLPYGALDKVDDVIQKYEDSMSAFHPISPLSFSNPFYKLSDQFKSSEGKTIERPKAIIDSKDLYLMDAGLDNNIPFYPLLRPERKVDLILAIDLSADIQTTTHFNRAESYIKRRGIEGWPTGAGWPKQPHDNSDDKYPLGSCTIFEASTEEQLKTKYQTRVKHQTRQVTLAYFPFILNKAYDPEFDPQTEDFCRTWNFVYSSEQVNKVTGLAEANWNDNVQKIKFTLKKIWENKREERLSSEL